MKHTGTPAAINSVPTIAGPGVAKNVFTTNPRATARNTTRVTGYPVMQYGRSRSGCARRSATTPSDVSPSNTHAANMAYAASVSYVPVTANSADDAPNIRIDRCGVWKRG